MKTKRLLTFCIVLPLLFSTITFSIGILKVEAQIDASKNEWPMFRQNPQSTGLSLSAAPNCSLLWRFFTGSSSSLADRLRATPTVSNGVVYIGSSANLYALNASNGKVIWQVNVGSQIESSAAVAYGFVYVGILFDGRNGFVAAYNATNGCLVWRFATNSGIESSPVVVNGVVYIGSYSGYV
jgi:outer membrane protein assembly factor BamB